MNKVILSGNLTRDPELKQYSSTTVAKFGLAVSRPTAKNEPDFFNVAAFGKTAEFIGKYFSKGSRAIIEGRLQNSSYTDKDGNKRTSFEVMVDNIEFGDSKKKSDAEPPPPATSSNDDIVDDVDLPF